MRPLPVIVTALSLLLLSSCSLPYHLRWQRAASANATTRPATLAGAWQGSWRSEGTGHHGRLRAIVTPASPADADTNVQAWNFHYHATWARILSGSYHSIHAATPAVPPPSPSWTISGHQNLGKIFGGVFHYQGFATPTHFKATYRSQKDHGVFELQRPSRKQH